MKTTADFLDDLRTHFGLPSDGKLAIRMGWARQQLSRYRTKKEVFGDQTAMRVADELGIERGYVIACMKAQLAKTPELRRVWEKMAAKVAACLVLAVALQGMPSPAPAAILHNQNGQTVPAPVPAAEDLSTHMRQYSSGYFALLSSCFLSSLARA